MGDAEDVDEALAAAVEGVLETLGTVVDVEDRTLRLVEPVRGDLGNAVLKVLGQAEDASPVGAAARGAGGVAAGVWRRPELYLARWTRGRLWVVGYRLTGGSRPNGYVRSEGRIPSRFETARWYGAVPDEVDEAFLEVGMLLDDPPFPVPAPPPPSAPPPPARPAGRATDPPPRRRPPAPAPRAPRPAVAGAGARPGSARVCTGCRMHKSPSQFVAGSDLCVDCR